MLRHTADHTRYARHCFQNHGAVTIAFAKECIGKKAQEFCEAKCDAVGNAFRRDMKIKDNFIGDASSMLGICFMILLHSLNPNALSYLSYIIWPAS